MIQIAKHHTNHADEVSQLRREVTRTQDTVEIEKTKRLRSEAQEETVRAWIDTLFFCVSVSVLCVCDLFLGSNYYLIIIIS